MWYQTNLRWIRAAPTRPMLGFKSFRAARAILAGIELMHRVRKGQFMLKRGGLSFADQFLCIGKTSPFCLRSRWRNLVPLCLAPANATQPVIAPQGAR